MSKRRNGQSSLVVVRICVLVLVVCAIGLTSCATTKTKIKYVDWHEGYEYHNNPDASISKSVNVVSCADELNKLQAKNEKLWILVEDLSALNAGMEKQMQKMEEEIIKLQGK